MAFSRSPDPRTGLYLRWPLLAGVLIALPFIGLTGYELHLFIISAIFVILSSSLSLIMGYGGLLSLAHAAFFGIGAYTSALLFMNFRLSMWVGLPAAGIASAIAAICVGSLFLKVRGHRFVITSLAFVEIMRLIAVNAVDLTRGQMGLPGIQAPVLTIPGIGTIDFASKTAFYFLAVGGAAICVWTVARIVHSPIGWGLLALRENENLGESVGVSAFRHAMIAFVVGAFFAGIAGSLYAHYTGFVSPDLFFFSYTVTMLVMVVIGGKATILGPIVGAIAFTFLPEYLRVVAQYRLVLVGVVLLATVLAFPNGLVELWSRWLRPAFLHLRTLRSRDNAA